MWGGGIWTYEVLPLDRQESIKLLIDKKKKSIALETVEAYNQKAFVFRRKGFIFTVEDQQTHDQNYASEGEASLKFVRSVCFFKSFSTNLSNSSKILSCIIKPRKLLELKPPFFDNKYTVEYKNSSNKTFLYHSSCGTHFSHN